MSLKENVSEIIPGQINIFDYEKQSKDIIFNKLLIKNNNVLSVFSLDQKIKYSKLLETKRIRRVILYCSGVIGIETWSGSSVKTTCIYKDGSEFSYTGASGVLPMDKIIYYSGFKIKTSDVQIKRINRLKANEACNIKRIIKRKGDFNILLELDNKVSSILLNGWVLDFNLINKIEYDAGEVWEV